MRKRLGTGRFLERKDTDLRGVGKLILGVEGGGLVVFSVPVQSVLSAVIGSEFFGKTITVSLLPHSLRLSSFRLIGSFSLLRSEIL